MSHQILRKSWIVLAVWSFGLLLLPGRGAAQTYNISPLDVKCDDCPGGIALSTAALGINPAGDIVGTYLDGAKQQHGFILSRGQFMPIDVRGDLAGVSGTLPTVARGISPSGEIVGTYTAPPSTAPFGSPDYCIPPAPATCVKGFLYSHGRFSTLLFPLPSGGVHPGAVPNHFTPDGSVYGC